jgi:hypothetical protein
MAVGGKGATWSGEAGSCEGVASGTDLRSTGIVSLVAEGCIIMTSAATIAAVTRPASSTQIRFFGTQNSR